MLRIPTLPASWVQLLCHFRPCFTAPTFTTFVAVVSGLVARPQRRTVTGMLIGAGLSRVWHHSRTHRFFSREVWSVEQVSRVVTALVVATLIPAGDPVLIAVDDTVFTRSGRRIAAAGWHHDATTKPRKGKDHRVRWGHCRVVAGIVVHLPLLDRPVCLPVAFVLWAPVPCSAAAEQSNHGYRHRRRDRGVRPDPGSR
ncbi:MAG TPA: transposase [Actinoplanes sp.]|nr:transposase [Actinoplanes sp.]